VIVFDVEARFVLKYHALNNSQLRNCLEFYPIADGLLIKFELLSLDLMGLYSKFGRVST
jgi:hypothetical protein